MSSWRKKNFNQQYLRKKRLRENYINNQKKLIEQHEILKKIQDSNQSDSEFQKKTGIENIDKTLSNTLSSQENFGKIKLSDKNKEDVKKIILPKSTSKKRNIYITIKKKGK